jgi:carboxymethylenebutenolidase
MCDQDHSEQDLKEFEAKGWLTRKQFGVMLGAGVSMMLPQVANAAAVTEAEVNIKTPDGTCDAYFVHPSTGTAPGVLMWPDIFGLRPAYHQMAKRLAESGYSVLVVNPFYRVQKAPTAAQGAATVAKNKKMGTQGYCMGGPMAFRTAVASDRVGAVGSFHGAALVTTMPNSPHLQVAKTKAQLLVAIAANDDQRAPTDKTVMKDTFASAKVPAEIEVYKGAHGWCAIDSAQYNQEEAERAWARLLDLYKKTLA